MNVKDLISPEEDYMILQRRKDSVMTTNDFCSNEFFLRHWAEEKSKYLFSMFGGKLIHKKEIKLSQTPNTIVKKLYEDTDALQKVDYFCRNLKSAFENFNNWREQIYLSELLVYRNIASGIYHGKTFTINTPTGKKITVQDGCKIIKMLGKIEHEYDVDGYEDFRLVFSLLTNNKTTAGHLCISIHPLDYITMSDNNSDWSSCMSWEESGCYCRGTVEMMNSPMVVVAYLSADSPYYIDPTHTWNNKKWRQLFIVTPWFITAIKSYPYLLPELTIQAGDFIKEICESNVPSIRYKTSFELKAHSTSDYLYPDGDTYSFSFMFSTNTMYNDFNTSNTFHYTWLNEYDPSFRDITYSGPENCVVCGEDTDCFFDAGDLACEVCTRRSRCEICGEPCLESEMRELDGVMLCEDCYDEHAVWDEVTEEYHLDEQMVEVVLVNLSDEEFDKMKNNASHYLDPDFNVDEQEDLSNCPVFTAHESFVENIWAAHDLRTTVYMGFEFEKGKINCYESPFRYKAILNARHMIDIPDINYWIDGIACSRKEVLRFIGEK